MTPHIEANQSDIAKTVLMPGDPLRATYIAENFLTNAKLVNSIRGIYAYTGTYKNKSITVMASGMGNPSMGIYSYELFHYYDVTNIIRIGTIGAYLEELNLKDLILAKASYSQSSYAKVQNGNPKTMISSSEFLNNTIVKTANRLNIPVLLKNVHCSDVFYSSAENFKEIVQEQDCAGVEMETFALFHNAQTLEKNATAILSVSNSFVKTEELTSEDRQNSLDTMITLALESTLDLD